MVLLVITTAALFALAVWVARDHRRTAHERDVIVFTVCLAAAFAASPIVWVHYFLLLLVPLALTHPRLSLLWFLPLVYYPLGESAWPAGDARKLGIALVATIIILAASVIRVVRDGDPGVRDASARRPARQLPLGAGSGTGSRTR